MNREKAPVFKTGAFSLSINLEVREYGKEDSYERNPGRVSFVFN